MNLLMMLVSMLGGGGWRGVNLFLTNQTDNLLNLAFGEITVKTLRTGLNRSLGHMWPPGLSLPTSTSGPAYGGAVLICPAQPVSRCSIRLGFWEFWSLKVIVMLLKHSSAL